MPLRLVLDLERCQRCPDCSVRCDYVYRAAPGEDGLRALREEATFLLVCRRCENASCVAACPTEALERRSDGVMVRHNLRCISCKSCVSACPFGTILPDLVPFYAVPCDHCALRRNGGPPACVDSCADGALVWRDVTGEEPDLHVLSDVMAVRTPRWRKREEVAA